MKKTLHTLLTATALMSTSFAASTSDDSERAAGKTSTHNLAPTIVSIIDDVTQDECAHGVLIPKFQYSQKTGSFVGSPLKFKIGDSTLTIERDTNTITANKGYSKLKEQPLSTCGNPKEFYNTLFDFFSLMALNQTKQDVTTATLTTYDLLKLRQITAKVFSRDTNSWMVGSIEKLYELLHEIVEAALNRYHFPNFEKPFIKSRNGVVIDDTNFEKLIKDTYEAHVTSDNCAKDIKNTFLKVSEVLAVAAYQCRANNDSPIVLLSKHCYSGDVALFITMLFKLDDTDPADEALNLFGEDYSLAGLHKLSALQKEFAERWLTTVLSPLNIPLSCLKPSEVDGFALIPFVVEKAETLWNEYARHVFGITTDVVFKKVPTSNKDSQTEEPKDA